jgi:hypothetical protein
MHDALHAQHPEWIEADGKSPTCDSYEAPFAELLISHLTKDWQACARPDYAEERKTVFSKLATS